MIYRDKVDRTNDALRYFDAHRAAAKIIAFAYACGTC
jgi:hypothetical protein